MEIRTRCRRTVWWCRRAGAYVIVFFVMHFAVWGREQRRASGQQACRTRFVRCCTAKAARNVLRMC
jgi:hypothetical protein